MERREPTHAPADSRGPPPAHVLDYCGRRWQLSRVAETVSARFGAAKPDAEARAEQHRALRLARTASASCPCKRSACRAQTCVHLLGNLFRSVGLVPRRRAVNLVYSPLT